MAQSRKRRKDRQRATKPDRPGASAPTQTGGYARGRAKDEAARAALKPLRPGERPTAVTVGAIVAALLAAANVAAMVAGVDALSGDTDESRSVAFTLLWSVVLLAIAWGMWRAKYWAVLGMQTLLGITLVLTSLSLISAADVVAAVVLVLILVAAGTLFWFMVKAMARIQMPERPTRAR